MSPSYFFNIKKTHILVDDLCPSCITFHKINGIILFKNVFFSKACNKNIDEKFNSQIDILRNAKKTTSIIRGTFLWFTHNIKRN